MIFDRQLQQALLAILERLQVGCLTLDLPDGTRHRIEHPQPAGRSPIHADLRFTKPSGIRRVFSSGGSVGLAEAYMAQEAETNDLYALMDLVLTNAEIYEATEVRHPLRNMLMSLYHRFRANTKRGARRNIAAHYDLGNDFYQLWLDSSMTYSSAVFDTGANALETAQAAKYEAILDAARVKPGNSVLEIGCGWGGFAEYAAKTRNCQVTGITISREQLAFAQRRIAEQGLNDQVTLKLQDYRDVPASSHDHLVSIEMFEAVGQKYWPTYFAKLREVLKPGGHAGLQIITIDEAHFEDYQRDSDFIQQYIFPGGMLPSPPRLLQEVQRAGLTYLGDRDYADSYAKTLLEWNKRFQAAWPQIQALRSTFDERFRRMWEYYLLYCAAGFAHARLGVLQVSVQREA